MSLAQVASLISVIQSRDVVFEPNQTGLQGRLTWLMENYTYEQIT